MILGKIAIAGTLESSDVQITLEPGSNGIELSISSTVINQFGKEIKATVSKTLENLGVTNAKVMVVDKGALDCTIKARVETAVYRSLEQEDHFPWGGAIS